MKIIVQMRMERSDRQKASDSSYLLRDSAGPGDEKSTVDRGIGALDQRYLI